MYTLPSWFVHNKRRTEKEEEEKEITTVTSFIILIIIQIHFIFIYSKIKYLTEHTWPRNLNKFMHEIWSVCVCVWVDNDDIWLFGKLIQTNKKIGIEKPNNKISWSSILSHQSIFKIVFNAKLRLHCYADLILICIEKKRYFIQFFVEIRFYMKSH